MNSVGRWLLTDAAIAVARAGIPRVTCVLLFFFIGIPFFFSLFFFSLHSTDLAPRQIATFRGVCGRRRQAKNRYIIYFAAKISVYQGPATLARKEQISLVH